MKSVIILNLVEISCEINCRRSDCSDIAQWNVLGRYRILRNIKKICSWNLVLFNGLSTCCYEIKKWSWENIFGSIIHRITNWFHWYMNLFAKLSKYFLKKIQTSNNQQALKNISSIDGSKFKKTSWMIWQKVFKNNHGIIRK